MFGKWYSSRNQLLFYRSHEICPFHVSVVQQACLNLYRKIVIIYPDVDRTLGVAVVVVARKLVVMTERVIVTDYAFNKSFYYK
ncbi:hypothetical protein Barb4_05531 [Bacteroidales bacterium Barb4]|nr:hypothetical protein Barb4_05531 [Bacteroidales bacterium Barb4]